MSGSWTSTLLWLLPLGGALAVLVLPLGDGVRGALALSTTIVTAALALAAAVDFDPSGGTQFEQSHAWVRDLGLTYHVGMDGLSLVLVTLTAVCVPCALGYGLWARRPNLRSYAALMLLLEAAVVLLLVARDLALFYVGFEAMIVPLALLIAVWGGPNRARATIRFVIYTLIGSLLMLVAVITLGVRAGSFDLASVGTSDSRWLFLAFMAAFAIKAPLYPFHGWVPDAYREAPPEVAGLLSGVVSKAGAYGMLRFALPLFPGPAHDLRRWFVAIAVAGLLWASLMAFRQPDSRGVIAYSSIAQMSLIGLGIFVMNDIGATGATFQMVNHGLLSVLLFLLAGVVEVRTGTGLFRRLGGLARGRAGLSTIVMTTGIAALAVPGSALFASEFLVLLGAFRDWWLIGALASLAILLSAIYMLRWISALLHDAPAEPSPGLSGMRDLRWETAYLVPLVVAVLALSAYPYAVTHRVSLSLHGIVSAVTAKAAPVIAAAAVATPSVQLGAILPAVVLTAGALVLLLVGSFERRGARVTSGVIGLVSFAGAGLATWHLWDDGNGTAFSGQLATDRYAALVQAIVCASGLASILLGWGTRRLGDRIAEYYSLLCFAGAGMCVLAAANGFVSLFIALELFSISLYVLCALDVNNEASLESGLKYLVTGSVGSAALLFGSGLAYISAGSLRFDQIGKALDAGGEHTGILLLGIAMVVAGLAFKASAAPFHMWTPDVYEGAPTAVMAFMATATKTIALATLLRLMTTAFAPSSDVWEGAVAAVAIASMLIGNVAALRQANVKRMLAYSSVGQAGYLLIAVVVHTPLATRALLYYLAVYAAMNLGALAVVSVREREVGGPVSIGDLRGLGRDHPLLAGGLALCLLSLASFPPTGGFLAKLYLFGSAIDAGKSYLAVIGVIGTMISLAYYLRFLLAIYAGPASEARPRTVPGTRLAATAVFVSAAIVLWLGIAPQPLVDVARTAAASLAAGG